MTKEVKKTQGTDKVVKFTANDSLRNASGNIGNDRDKSSHSSYYLEEISRDQLTTMYRGSWLPKKIVDIPALDSVRNWRSWNSSKENITLIEREEKRLKVKAKVLSAQILSRLYGRSALYINIGKGDPSTPLDPRAIRKGGIKSLALIPDVFLSPTEHPNMDIDSEYFLRSDMWEIARTDGVPVKVHPSRLIFFFGSQVPEPSMVGMGDEGDSVLLSVIEAVRQSDSTVANIASLVFEAKIDVLSIPGLMDNVADPKYVEDLLKRFTIAATSKSNNGMLMIDDEENYEQKQMTFASLPDIMDRFFQNVSGAADIPMTRLFGMSPGGMNSTGDSDLSNYYDRIKSIQELFIGPAMDLFDECLVRSAIGVTPRTVFYTWEPLWQETGEAKAKIAKLMADVITILKAAGLFKGELLAKATANMIIESDILPGFEELLDEYGDEAYEGEVPDVNGQTNTETGQSGNDDGKQIGGRIMVDAAPMSLYVYRKVLNPQDLISWAKDNGFETTVDPEELHVTVMYSASNVDWMKLDPSWSRRIEMEGGPRIMEQLGDAAVLSFRSPELEWRHKELIDGGAVHSYPTYQPHVTFSYNVPENLSSIKPYTGLIVLGPEIFDTINEDYRKGLMED